MNLKKLTSIAILTIPSLIFAQEAKNEDRSYFADFAKEKPTLSFKDPTKPELVQYIFEGKETIAGKPRFILSLVGDEKQQLIISESNEDMSFSYVMPELYSNLIKDYLIADDKDSAIREMRRDIYALFPLIEENEVIFPIHDNILEYIELLIATERSEELYSIFEKLNFKKLREEYTNYIVELAEILAKKGDFERSLKVLDSLNIEANRTDLIPELMDILTVFRDAKRIDDISRYYLRIQAVPECKNALEAQMWSLYCDIQKENVLTAAVLLKHFDKVDKKAPEYSLYKMISGLIAKKNNENIRALENFSEGIVYGKSIDDWMPELMYNTALSYSNADKIEVAMQILEEMRMFYPENVFLIQAEVDVK